MSRTISTATLTPFLPAPGKGNGAAVIVAPGGGFRWLSMGNEGLGSCAGTRCTGHRADAEAAYAMNVKRAKEWGVDTARLGMIGFSAGAALTMHCTLNSKVMELDFIGPIYGGMGPVEVSKNAPPMFNVIATDDFLFRGQFGVIDSWFKAGKPVEFHLYQNGGHGFGLGNPNRTSNKWFDAFIHWLDVNGFLAAK